MNELKELEIKKLINEIIFLKEDLRVIKEISSKIEEEFNLEIDNLIKEDSHLKEQWETSINKDSDKIIKPIKKDNTSDNDKGNQGVIKDEYIKKIYRDIAKITHPDKINDSDKNITYLKATESYNKNDILDLIFYANKLGIEYNHNALDLEKMKENINKIRSEIRMYETSLPYKWYYSDKDESLIRTHIAKKFLTR